MGFGFCVSASGYCFFKTPDFPSAVAPPGFWDAFSRMLRRRVPVLKLGWEVTKRRCAVSAKRPQSVRKASAKRPQSVRKRPQASASVREWRNACC